MLLIHDNCVILHRIDIIIWLIVIKLKNMRTKFKILLTAILMLFGMSASAQVNGNGKTIATDLDVIINAIIEGSSVTEADINDDGKVNVVDIVDFNNMTTVNLIFTNTGTQSITIAPRFRFVLDSGFKEAAWFAPSGSKLVINPGEPVTIENVLIPNGRQQIGQTFADDGGNYPSNVVIYDENYYSDTYVPQMINSSITFEEGATYNIYISGSETPNPPVDPGSDISVNLNIINQTSSAISLDGDVVLVLGNPDVYGNYYVF